LLFPGYCVANILKTLIPDEAITFIGGAEAFDFAEAMFFYSPWKVIGDSAIERVAAAGNQIDVVAVFLATHEQRLYCGGEQQVPPLRSPGFPVELGGFGKLHAPLFTERRIRGSVQRGVAGDPGTLRSG
jgi:hypothetical protein